MRRNIFTAGEKIFRLDESPLGVYNISDKQSVLKTSISMSGECIFSHHDELLQTIISVSQKCVYIMLLNEQIVKDYYIPLQKAEVFVSAQISAGLLFLATNQCKLSVFDLEKHKFGNFILIKNTDERNTTLSATFYEDDTLWVAYSNGDIMALRLKVSLNYTITASAIMGPLYIQPEPSYPFEPAILQIFYYKSWRFMLAVSRNRFIHVFLIDVGIGENSGNIDRLLLIDSVNLNTPINHILVTENNDLIIFDDVGCIFRVHLNCLRRMSDFFSTSLNEESMQEWKPFIYTLENPLRGKIAVANLIGDHIFLADDEARKCTMYVGNMTKIIRELDDNHITKSMPDPEKVDFKSNNFGKISLTEENRMKKIPSGMDSQCLEQLLDVEEKLKDRICQLADTGSQNIVHIRRLFEILKEEECWNSQVENDAEKCISQVEEIKMENVKMEKSLKTIEINLADSMPVDITDCLTYLRKVAHSIQKSTSKERSSEVSDALQMQTDIIKKLQVAIDSIQI